MQYNAGLLDVHFIAICHSAPPIKEIPNSVSVISVIKLKSLQGYNYLIATACPFNRKQCASATDRDISMTLYTSPLRYVDVLAVVEYPDSPSFFVAAVNPPRNIWPPPNLNV